MVLFYGGTVIVIISFNLYFYKNNFNKKLKIVKMEFKLENKDGIVNNVMTILYVNNAKLLKFMNIK
jgi:hypothetical protein